MGDEQSVYGVKAALALIEKRPSDVVRLHYRKDRRAQLKGVLSWAASRRLPYRELDDDALRKVAGGSHHEGVVVIARPLRYAAFTPAPPEQEDQSASARHKPVWVAVDGVDNPHNLGAIVRSCAFFGATGLLVGGPEPGEKVNQAAIRIAEGGAEYVRLAAVPDLARTLGDLAAQGWMVLGLETDGTLLPRLRLGRPLALVLGNEQEGLGPSIRASCTAVHRIPGTGSVASLNVSVAAGVALALLHSND